MKQRYKNIEPFNPRQHMVLKDLEIHHYKDSEELTVDIHNHDFYEILFFISGSVSYKIESRVYLPQAGDILLVSPFELHNPTVDPSQTYERIVLWIAKSYLDQFIGDYADLTVSFDTHQPNHTNLVRLSAPKQAILRELLEGILIEWQGTRFGNRAMAGAYLCQILVEINRSLLESNERYEQKDKTNPLIDSVLAYINTHYSEDLSLDTLSSLFYINKYHLSHEFNRVVGISAYRYIIQKRLIMARQMLLAGTPPTSVYQNCGFSDYANFYRAFKSKYGLSPKEFLLSTQ